MKLPKKSAFYGESVLWHFPHILCGLAGAFAPAKKTFSVFIKNSYKKARSRSRAPKNAQLLLLQHKSKDTGQNQQLPITEYALLPKATAHDSLSPKGKVIRFVLQIYFTIPRNPTQAARRHFSLLFKERPA